MFKPKTLLAGLFVVLGSAVWAQPQCIWVTDSLYIRFYSDEIVEDIDAYTTQGAGAYNRCTNTVFFKVPAAAFIFKNELMGEHYREQYMETDKYPYITFRGSLQVPDMGERVGTFPAIATGKFNIHGTERKRTIKGTVTVFPDGTFSGRAVFWMKPTDYNIKQPSMMGVTAADSVQVTVYFHMVPYQPSKK